MRPVHQLLDINLYKLLLSLVTEYDMELEQGDVKTALCHNLKVLLQREMEERFAF